MSDSDDGSAQQVTITDAQRKLLTDALVVPKPFHAEGVWRFPKAQFNLFYRAQGSCGCVDLSKDGATDAALKSLADACQPATFGLNQNDVLDETYRKAGKLDNENFAVNLDIVGSGLLDAVNDGLFGWQEDARFIRAELYKLNVYGPGSFFKAHRDTPRSERMFGSLVLTFATAHEGGALVLRHAGTEVEHSTSDSSGFETPYQLFWATFFSDVEHEVLPVTSGHRVTLTYNLYYTAKKGNPRPAPPDELEDAFDALLADATFMPAGGRLGFGLRHAYPVPANVQWNSDWFMENLLRTLKGSDHALFAAAEQAGLEPELRVVYDDSDMVWMLPYLWSGGNEVESLGSALYEDRHRNAEVLEGDLYDHPYWHFPEVRDLVWILPRKSKTKVGTHYGCYGNEATSEVLYGSIVLIATVPSAEDRAADDS